MLDHGEKHAQFSEREPFCGRLVEDVAAIGAEVQSLVRYLALEVIWQVQEDFDQIAVNDLGEVGEVDFALDMALPEGLVVAPGLAMAVAVSSDRQASSQVEVPLILPHLLLQSVEKFGDGLDQERAG